MPKINPRVDFAFKILFGSEGSKDILLPFLNAVLAPAMPLTELTLLNPYNHKTHGSDKLSILDIKAKNALGKIYHIEMQMNDRIAYDQRALYYWSKIYSQQLNAGEDFSQLKKTISIHILNFNHLDDIDYHNVYHILNAKTHRRYTDDLELHFIELKKFTKDLSHLTTALDRWTTFLTKAEQWERNFIPVELKDDPAIEKAAHALDTLSLDKEELEIYEAQLKWIRDQSAILEKTRQVHEARGRKKGRQEGEAIGIKKGELASKRAFALKLLARQLPVEEIAALTELSSSEITALLAMTIES